MATKFSPELARRIKSHVESVEGIGPSFRLTGKPRILNESAPSAQKWVQAPSGGIPKCVGARPGVATCTILVRATENSPGILINDLIKTSNTVRILNYRLDIAGADGDRRVLVTGHTDNSEVIDWECDNDGVPSDFPNKPVEPLLGFQAAEPTPAGGNATDVGAS